MNNKDEFEFFIKQLFDNAVSEFKATEQYRLLQEKLNWRLLYNCDFAKALRRGGITLACK